ncbi:MAG: hypothetical protein ABGZ36_26750 [Actinomycetota bacterium]|uniref:peptidoglycan-binding protein n=1 Tax=Euzebya rosea TaxID=2052804 RepID=UPI0013004856|nr:peptidoglycan-binding protein [Euzebya rosea]
MPRAVDVVAGWLLALAFLGGGGLYLLAQRLIQARAKGSGRMWMIYLAIASDLFSDGLPIGAGASLGGGLGLVLAVGQVLADVPEGAASTMTFRGNDVPRSRRLLLSVATVVPVLVGAALSFLVLRGRPERWQLTALVRRVAAEQAAVRAALAAADQAAEPQLIGRQAVVAGGQEAWPPVMACPLGPPNGFSSSWGAPRSGGRSHEGVDMFAARGTPWWRPAPAPSESDATARAD